MPLIETIGSSSAKAFGLTGLKAIDGLQAGTAAPSARYLYDTLGYRTNGAYWLNPTGTNPFKAWCIMDRDGGGWVKVAQYYNGTDISGASAINENGTWTTQERNLAAGKLRTADIDALHQTKTTFLTRVLQTTSGAHRYWRYRVGSSSDSYTTNHFPRAARIGLTINNSLTSSHGTDQDIIVFTPDNCADGGTIPSNGTVYAYDFGSAVEVTGSYFYSTFNGGYRAATVTIEYSDNNSSWTTAWTGPVSNNSNQCGIIRTGVTTYDPMWSWGAGTMKYVGSANAPSWGTDQDPTAYTLYLDSSSNGNYLYSKAYGNDTRGRCTHVGDGWVFPSDHNYTNSAICWSYNKTAFSTNFHWMGGNGNENSTGYSYSGGELRFGLNSTSSAAVYVK